MANEKASRLSTITVTARRREESLQEVPIAVTAFTDQNLQTLNVQNLGDLKGQVPNLQVFAARGSNTTITAYIRGIGQSDPTWGSDPGVGIYLNDVYIARPQGALLDIYDVQRVEVLRGPQGTLYGKNTIGGAIKYVSKPLPTQTEGFVQADAGEEGTRNIKLGLGGASDDGVWRGRVAYASLHNGGFGENILTGSALSNQNTNAGRISAGFFPKDAQFDAQFSADVAHDNSGQRGGRLLAPNVLAAVLYKKTFPPLDSDYDNRADMPNINHTHTWGTSLTMNWYASSAWTLKSISAYRKGDSYSTIDFDMLPLPIGNVSGAYRDHQTSQELQAVYDGGNGLSGVTGLYYFKGRAGGTIHNIFVQGTPAQQFGSTDGHIDTRSVAAYTDWSWQFAPAWSGSAGLRYTDEKKTAFVDSYAFSDATFTNPIVGLANFNRSTSSSNVAPRFSLTYKASDSTNLYASAARGFKSGGYNIRANTLFVPRSALPVKDETVDTYEIGSKSTFADGRFTLDAALFHTRYRDIQLSIFTSYTSPTGAKGFFGDLRNAGKAHADGAEVEFGWRPDEHWALTGNAAALHTGYDEYRLDDGSNAAARQRFVNSPRFQSGLNLEYKTPVSFGGEVTAHLGYTYQTKVFPTTDLSPAIAQGPYGLIGAGVIWNRDEHWSFSLQGSNLANKSYRTDGYNIPALYILSGFYGPPRVVYASAKYKF